MVFVVPKFRDVASGMGLQRGPLRLFVFAITNWLIVFEIFVSLMMFAAVLAYVGGPVEFVRCGFNFALFPSWTGWPGAFSGNAKRFATHTFSAMLAVLLDGGVPETEAVRPGRRCHRQ